MISNTTPKSKIINTLSTFNMFLDLSQAFMPVVFGYLATYFGAKFNPQIYGNLVLAFIILGYTPAVLFYHFAGKEYVKIIKRDE